METVWNALKAEDTTLTEIIGSNGMDKSIEITADNVNSYGYDRVVHGGYDIPYNIAGAKNMNLVRFYASNESPMDFVDRRRLYEDYNMEIATIYKGYPAFENGKKEGFTIKIESTPDK